MDRGRFITATEPVVPFKILKNQRVVFYLSILIDGGETKAPSNIREFFTCRRNVTRITIDKESPGANYSINDQADVDVDPALNFYWLSSRSKYGY